MDIFADRFVRTAGGWLDLATGEPVRLRISQLHNQSRVARWCERLAVLWEIRHPHIVTVVDYGLTTGDSVFEALRVPPATAPWLRRDVATARVLASAVQCLLAHGVSAGHLDWDRVIDVGGRPLLLPDTSTAMPLEPSTTTAPGGRAASHKAARRQLAALDRLLDDCGSARSGGSSSVRLRRLARPPGSHPQQRPLEDIRALIEVIESGRSGEPRHFTFATRSPGESSAVTRFVAREARLRGYIPLSTVSISVARGLLSAGAVRALMRQIKDRHVLLIHEPAYASDHEPTDAIALVLDLGLASTRPHLFVSVVTDDRRTASVLRPVIGSRSASTHRLGLVCGACRADPAIEPDLLDAAPGRVSEQRSDYAARGAPGSRQSGLSAPVAAAPGSRLLTSRVSEDEGVSAGTARARGRHLEGLRLARHGRHAAGERMLREALGALVRRGDMRWAGRAALDLGRVLHRRGRVREAAAAYEQARGLFERCGWPAAAIRAAIYVGLVRTDNGQLCEAESALRAAAIAAGKVGSAEAGEFAALGLARCLAWQRRWDEAQATLGRCRVIDSGPGTTSAAPPPPASATGPGNWILDGARGCREASGEWRGDEDVDPAVVRACLESRIAVGRGELAAAGLWATRAAARAGQTADAGDRAVAHTAAARVHAEIADIEGLRGHVRDGLRAAAVAHAPLEGIRLRLLLLDGLRRVGSSAEADRLASRLSRLRRDTLPFLLRHRVEAAAHGRFSTNIMTGPTTSQRIHAHQQDAIPLGEASDRAAGSVAALASEIVELAQSCHEIADEGVMLEKVVAHLRQHLRASSAAFFGLEGTGLAAVAASGSRPFPLEIARRACDAELCILPDDAAARHEAAVPVRYAGTTIGALACRWPADVCPPAERSTSWMSAAAALAAPGLRTALDRRASPQAVQTAEPELMGQSSLMTDLRLAIGRSAATPFPVLVEGESGSGKELVARAIHRLSARRERKFCALNCAALTDELLEAELFGHARGAFTGAVGDRPGLFEDADGGTLVLDEVRELSARAQAKLLRALQEGEIRRVGENLTRSVDVRVVALTNRSLIDEVAAGRFRRDLFYRLAVIRVAVPPLRDRIEDIPILAGHFWAHAVARTGSRATLAAATVAALSRYDWPGNVRELQNVMTALAVTAARRGSVGPASLPAAFAVQGATPGATLMEARRAFELRFVRAALAQAGGHRGRAARGLGLSRQGFAKVLVRLGVEPSGTLSG